MADLESGYVRRLSYVLRKRDVDELRDFLKAEAGMRDPDRVAEIEDISDHNLEFRMHKMILARSDLGDMHADARRWLNENEQSVAGMEW